MNYSIFSKNKNKRGFTLTELIVVITITTVIMTALVVQQNRWNDQLTVSTQAYEMVLMIRQAQIYSLGVRGDSAGTGDKFNIGYGVYLSQNNLNGYILFADRNGDKIFTSADGQPIETKNFNRGVTIKDVCGTGSNGCFPGNGPLASVSILFFRPETKANMALLNAGGNSTGDPPITIRLQSSGGKYSSVKIEGNGQISIQ